MSTSSKPDTWYICIPDSHDHTTLIPFEFKGEFLDRPEVDRVFNITTNVTLGQLYHFDHGGYRYLAASCVYKTDGRGQILHGKYYPLILQKSGNS